MSFQADYVAVSFPKNATDMEMARQLCNVAAAPYRHKPGLIAKIERAEAIPAWKKFESQRTALGGAGRPGGGSGNEAVPALQKKMIRMARDMDKLLITATQMMESMIANPVPTRAEVSDGLMLQPDGTDAVMPSVETAAGGIPWKPCRRWPRFALQSRRRRMRNRMDFTGRTFPVSIRSIAMGALFTAHHLGAKAISRQDGQWFYGALDEPPP